MSKFLIYQVKLLLYMLLRIVRHASIEIREETVKLVLDGKNVRHL